MERIYSETDRRRCDFVALPLYWARRKTTSLLQRKAINSMREEHRNFIQRAAVRWIAIVSA